METSDITLGDLRLTTDPRVEVDLACKAAETFSKLYYETMDKRRHMLSKFYTVDATLVWNGNNAAGEVAIGQFYDGLPVSYTTLASLSSIPVSDVAVNSQTTVLVQVGGQVRFEGRSTVPFFQTFLLTVQDEKWKVLTDTFRFQEIV